MNQPFMVTFDIYKPPELSAGFAGYTEQVTIIVDSGNVEPPADFIKHFQSAIEEWFDGATVNIAP